jgi:D-alanine-D-alanine ligase-like ATP-grasp enzyme
MTHVDHFRSITKPLAILPHLKSGDSFICFWNDEEALKAVSMLPPDVTLFPTRAMIDFAANREMMTRFVSQHSAFSANREYLSFPGETKQVIVPDLGDSSRVVCKVGEEHCGEDKFLLYPGQSLWAKDSVIFEEFLPDAHSFRVLIIGEQIFVIEYFDDPDFLKPDDKVWIKNISPLLVENEIHDNFTPYIEDAKNMANLLGYDYLGVDYVKTADRVICLEANTFPGVRLNERTQAAALSYWRDKIINLKNP